ncbi:response regulator [Herbaspirillum sp. RV1423]|uniref:ATP-binding response regulator n=1 Tax=Herbaspirillum sp. RV1423 TaxID=1443993 RepID=UPI0004BC00C1|nr:response regulator [Herbaspirillum sp. RV1423]
MINTSKIPILIVDDDPVFRQSLCIVLGQAPNEWHCYEAENVRQATTLMTEHVIALAIVDINLPDGTAADVVRNPDAPPCLLCTQDDKEPTFQSMFADPSIAQNLVGYLIKPMQQSAIWSIRAGLEIGRERQMRSRLIAEATAQLEEERRLIAQNLHDAVGAAITQLTWIFAGIGKAASTLSVDTSLSQHMQHIETSCMDGKKILAQAHADVSQAITQLRPEAISVGGLTIAIEDMVGQWRKAAPQVSFALAHGSCLDKVDARRAGTLYRLVQEGITNVMRHTDPAEVLIEMIDRGPSLILKILSRGKILVEKDTYKLTILRERTSSLGGVLQFFCDAEREETCLVVSIPV